MKKIVWILMVVMALLTTKADASDSGCGNRTSPEISAKRTRVLTGSILATPWRFVNTHRHVFPSQKDFG
jgi:hypothetical protein